MCAGSTQQEESGTRGFTRELACNAATGRAASAALPAGYTVKLPYGWTDGVEVACDCCADPAAPFAVGCAEPAAAASLAVELVAETGCRLAFAPFSSAFVYFGAEM